MTAVSCLLHVKLDQLKVLIFQSGPIPYPTRALPRKSPKRRGSMETTRRMRYSENERAQLKARYEQQELKRKGE